MNIEYTRRLEKIEQVLNARLPHPVDPAWMKESFSVLPDAIRPAHFSPLVEPCRDLMSRGGKRWRPLLMTLACELAGGGDRAYPLVPLVEFPHTASLIHDDIEDGADERRGGAAIHLLWGEDTAINSASWLYFQSLSIIDSFPSSDELKLSLYRTVTRELRRLHLGQAMDIHWHRTAGLIPSRAEYEAMVSMKTGTLSRLAGEVGMLAGGAPDEEAVEFGNIAAQIGVGFQIVDDVINLTTGNPGKKRGDDVVEGKKSLPVILHLERKPGDLAALTELFEAAKTGGIADPSVEKCIALLESSGAVDSARTHGIELIECSSARFVAKYPDSPAAPLIEGLFAAMLKGL